MTSGSTVGVPVPEMPSRTTVPARRASPSAAAAPAAEFVHSTTTSYPPSTAVVASGRVGRPEPHGLGDSLGSRAHEQQLARGREPEEHDREQTQWTIPDDRDAGAGRGNADLQQPGGDAGGRFDERGGRDRSAGVERMGEVGRHDEPVGQGPRVGESGFRVGGRAEVVAPFRAAGAPAARAYALGDERHAGFDPDDVGTAGHDVPRPFVPGYHRIAHVLGGAAAVEQFEIRAAQADRGGRDEDLPRTGLRLGQIREPVPAWAVHHKGAHQIPALCSMPTRSAAAACWCAAIAASISARS